MSLIPKICEYLNENESDVKIYDRSFTVVDDSQLLMIRVKNKKIIILIGQGRMYDELEGEEVFNCKLCGLNHCNRLIINKYLDYTVPKAFGKNVTTIGLGDRLGLTSAAHIKALNNREIKPVLAQQSKRELNLTGRTYDEILDAACYAVIQEGFKGGYGADGDHLKDECDIKSALDSGVSMITLDCSEKIDYSVEDCEEGELLGRYCTLPYEMRRFYEDNYIGREYFIGNHPIVFNKEILIKNVLIYGKVIDFIEYIYKKYIQCAGREIDFEISLDETASPTSMYGHYLVASEITLRNIAISSMAPRFVGEFQKGIDYIGDIQEFEEDLRVHAQVADHFGYKLSIHSGSDKFSVFGIIGKYTQGRFHIKTSGTNWLEAVRVISKKNPDLYRRMHKYAFGRFNEAKAYYHVSADLLSIKDIDEISDGDLFHYMEDNNARQLLHITYGILLEAKDNGISMFRDEIFETLDKYSDEYDKSIIGHIGKHLDSLACTCFGPENLLEIGGEQVISDFQKHRESRLKFSVTVSNNTSYNAPVLFGGDIAESIEKAKRMGYDAVELHFSNPLDVDVKKVISACEKYNVQVSAIATGSTYVINKLSLTDDSENIREAAINRIKEYVDLAQSLSSMVIIGCVRGNIADRSRYDIFLDRLTESMKQISDYSTKRNVPLVLEAINRYENNYLNTAFETFSFIKASNIPNLKILLDTFHMNIEEKEIINSIRESKELLGYIHAADSNRMYPGAGHINFKEILDTLTDIGYDGYISGECLPLPEGDTAAINGLEYLKSCLV